MFIAMHKVHGLKICYATSRAKALASETLNANGTPPRWLVKVPAKYLAAARQLKRMGWTGAEHDLVAALNT
jgi:hypothetical protein